MGLRVDPPCSNACVLMHSGLSESLSVKKKLFLQLYYASLDQILSSRVNIEMSAFNSFNGSAGLGLRGSLSVCDVIYCTGPLWQCVPVSRKSGVRFNEPLNEANSSEPGRTRV